MTVKIGTKYIHLINDLPKWLLSMDILYILCK